MDLLVDQPGSFISKHQGRLRVTKQRERLAEISLINLERVIINSRGISLSSDVIEACAEVGIPIHFLTLHGQAYASLYAAGLVGTIQTRRCQLEAEKDQRGLFLVKAFASGKLQNQLNLLKYLVKNHRENNPVLAAQVDQLILDIVDQLAKIDSLKGDNVAQIRGTLLAYEGRAAQHYWEAIHYLLKAELNWPGRKTQGATDPFNAALNYGYGVLYSQVERSLVLAGLDPYGGYLHVDRPGKPSLTFDLVEEFRQAVVDRPLIGVINRKFQIEQDNDGKLTLETRHDLAERILARLESLELYEGKRQPLRLILQQQARHIATFVRSEREVYQPFVMSW